MLPSVWPRINSVYEHELIHSFILKTRPFFFWRRRPWSSENMILVARRRKYFQRFLAIFGLLNSFQKEVFYYTRVHSILVNGPREEWRGLKIQSWRWKLNTQKDCILYLQMSVNLNWNLWWLSEFQHILEKLQIQRKNDMNHLAGNARFVAPSKCCKPSPLHSSVVTVSSHTLRDKSSNCDIYDTCVHERCFL